MVFSKECRFLASERKTSKKGNEYNVVSLLCGTDNLSVMADCAVDRYEFGQVLDINFDLNMKYMQMKVVSMSMIGESDNKVSSF